MDQRVSAEPVSKALYLGIYIGCSVVGGIVIGFGAFLMCFITAGMEKGGIESRPDTAILGAGVIAMLLGVPLLVTGAIFKYILYYKMWASIQDGYARTTPGKAVGFLFIPFFNIYWTFQAIWGYSKDYNEYLRRHSIPAKPLSEGLFLTACIAPFLGLIPFVGIFAQIALVVLYCFIINAICDRINVLAYAQPQTAVLEVEYASPQEPLQPGM